MKSFISLTEMRKNYQILQKRKENVKKKNKRQEKENLIGDLSIFQTEMRNYTIIEPGCDKNGSV